MTIFEQYQREKREQFHIGMQKGKLEGKRESLIEIAKNMLLLGMPLDAINKVTHLSLEEINLMKEENTITEN